MKYQKGTFIVVPNRGKLKGIGGNAQALFLWLCSYANTEGNCFPSLNTLAEDIGCSTRTVIREMERLVELGIVVKTNRKSNDEYVSNEYTVLVLEEGGGYDSQSLPSDSQSLGVVSNSHTNSIHINSNHLSVGSSEPKESTLENYEEDEYGSYYWKNGMKRYTKITVKEPPKSTELMKWAKEVKGARFTNLPMQMKAINKMYQAGYSKDEIKGKWEELEGEDFWMEKGIDFNVVASQIGKVKKKPEGALDLTKFRKK